MKILGEEIFGSVVVAAPFEEIDSIIAGVNDTVIVWLPVCGRSTSTRPSKIAKALKANTVWVELPQDF
jgi:acyl-CoA reductase-like NAD-dependent aldehyde dehydrogenase